MANMDGMEKQPENGSGDKNVDKDFDFLPGDVIQPYSKPFIKILYHGERQERCYGCFEVTDHLSRCANCKEVYYCGKKCQKSDWKNGHSLECKSDLFKNPIKELDGRIVDANLHVKILRSVAFLHLNPGKAEAGHEMYDGSTVTFNDLMGHEDKFEKKEHFMALFKYLTMKMKDDESFKVAKVDENFLLRLVGVWGTNAFEISDDSMLQAPVIGAGVYIQQSKFDHACRPNAVRVSRFPGCAMEIRCINAIPKGQKAFVSYLAGNRNRGQRQATLKLRYNFDCHCDLCEQELSGPAADYDSLIIEREKLVSMQVSMSWETTWEHMEIMRNYFRQLYHEYDERITNHYIDAFQSYYTRDTNNISKDKLAAYLNDTEERIRITFGTGHIEYVRFLRNVKPYVVPFGLKFGST